MSHYHANFEYRWIEETDTCVYECLSLRKDGVPTKFFENGCPVKDHAEYLDYGFDNKLLVLEGSSFTHLVMDFDDYRFIIDESGVERLIYDNVVLANHRE